MIFGYIRKKNEKKHRLIVDKSRGLEYFEKASHEQVSESDNGEMSNYSYSSNTSSYFDPPLLVTSQQ